MKLNLNIQGIQLLGTRKKLIPKIHKAKLTEIKGKIDNSIAIIRNCNTTFSKWIDQLDRPIRK